MGEQYAWICDCEYGEPEAEGGHMATLRRWAEHVRSAHGDEAFNEILGELVHERAEELRHEGQIVTDPFTGREHWMGEPPGDQAR
jgi:hypothetical protein